MREFLVFLLLFPIVLFALGQAVLAQDQTLVLQPGPEQGKDAYVCDCLPDVNSPNGDQGHLYQGQYHTCFDRLLIQWDLSSLPKGATIVSARMELYCIGVYGAISGQMAYYRLTEPWDENLVTFKTQPKYTEEGRVLTNWPAQGQWHPVDVTAFVRGWHSGAFPNCGIYGHCVGTTGMGVVGLVPSDGTNGMFRPKLTVVYTT